MLSFGLRSVARRAKLSPLLSETAARRTCRRLWQAIPDKYRQAHCYTDFWEASTKVLPEAQHTAVGKESGETAHVERWNLTLRQRAGALRAPDVIVLEVIGDARLEFNL